MVQKRLAPGNVTWRYFSQVLPHHAPAQSHLRIVCVAKAIAKKCVCSVTKAQLMLGWPGMDTDAPIYSVLPLWRGQKCLWLERHTQRFGFEPFARAFAIEGYLMSAFQNRKLKTSKASPASHGEAVV